jgi:hypothetical protein
MLTTSGVQLLPSTISGASFKLFIFGTARREQHQGWLPSVSTYKKTI